MGYGQLATTPLHRAARAGDLAKVERALGRDAFGGPRTRNVNAPDKKGHSALTLACVGGHAHVVRALVEDSRVDVNKQTVFGDSAILLASWKGHADCVRELLKSDKIDLNARTANGSTPLMLASYYGHKKVIEDLKTDTRVDVNAKNLQGKTATDVAASSTISPETEELRKLRKLAKKYKKQVDALKAQLRTVQGLPAVDEHEIAELQSMLQDARDDQRRLEEFGATKRRELEEAQQEIADLKKSGAQKDEEVKMLRAELDEARQASLSELERHSERNEQVLESLRRTLDDVSSTPPPDWDPAFREKELTKETEIEFLRRELDEARESNADLQRALTEVETHGDALSQAEIADVCTELENATADQDRIAELEQTVEKKNAEIALLVKQAEELSTVAEELEKAKQDRENLEAQSADKIDALRHLTDADQAYIMELEVARKKADGDINELQAALSAAKLSIAELEDRLKESAQAQSRVTELDELLATLDSQAQERVSELAVLREEAEATKAKLAKAHNHISELEAASQAVYAQNVELEQLVTQKEQELDNFRNEILNDLHALRPSIEAHAEDQKRMQALEKEVEENKSTPFAVEIVKGDVVEIATAANPLDTKAQTQVVELEKECARLTALLRQGRPRSRSNGSDVPMADPPAVYPIPTPLDPDRLGQAAKEPHAQASDVDEVAKALTNTHLGSPTSKAVPVTGASKWDAYKVGENAMDGDVKKFENGIKKMNRRLGRTDVTLEIHSPRKLLRVHSKGKEAKEYDLADPRVSLEWKTEGKSLILTVPDPKTGVKKPMKFTVGKTNKPVKQQMITDAYAAMSECMMSNSTSDDPMSAEEFSDPNAEMTSRTS